MHESDSVIETKIYMTGSPDDDDEVDINPALISQDVHLDVGDRVKYSGRMTTGTMKVLLNGKTQELVCTQSPMMMEIVNV